MSEEMTNEQAAGILKAEFMSCDTWYVRTALHMGIAALSAKPRTGHWIDINGDGSLFRCDKCSEEVCCSGNNYCPNCGAKMEGQA